MSGPACSTMAPCSQPSTPLRGAFQNSDRDGETPFNRTKKLFAASCGPKGEALDGFRAG